MPWTVCRPRTDAGLRQLCHPVHPDLPGRLAIYGLEVLRRNKTTTGKEFRFREMRQLLSELLRQPLRAPRRTHREELPLPAIGIHPWTGVPAIEYPEEVEDQGQ